MTSDLSSADRGAVRPVVADVVVVLVSFLVVGLVAGFLWPQLVDPVTVTRDDLGVTTGEVGLSQRFDNDGWYVVLAAACGLLLGAVLTGWRRAHEVVTLLAVVVGASLAAWVSAETGTWRGPEDPDRVLANARSGATAPDMVKVSASGAYLVWPIAAVSGALVVLWGRPGQRLGRRPDDDRWPPESEEWRR